MDDLFPPERPSKERRASTADLWVIQEVFDLRSRVKDLERQVTWLVFLVALSGLGSLLRFIAWVLS